MSGDWPNQDAEKVPEPAAAVPPPSEYVDPIIELYKKDVDRSLLRENLKLTVEQRFEKYERFMRVAEELRAAGRRSRSEG